MNRRKRIQNEQKDLQKSIQRSFAFKVGFFVLFILLLAANIFVFAQSVRLSDEIVELETNTLELRKENARLQQDIFTQSSLSNLEELADQLGFTNPAEPLYLEQNEYAQVR